MKILEKTIFRKKNIEILNLEKEIHKLNRENDIQRNNYKRDLDGLASANLKMLDELMQKEKARKKLASALGGYKKQINKLTQRLEDVNQALIDTKREFNEFKEGKYIVREIKPQKVPKTQKMGIRSGSVTSKIISKIKPIEEEEVEA